MSLQKYPDVGADGIPLEIDQGEDLRQEERDYCRMITKLDSGNKYVMSSTWENGNRMDHHTFRIAHQCGQSHIQTFRQLLHSRRNLRCQYQTAIRNDCPPDDLVDGATAITNSSMAKESHTMRLIHLAEDHVQSFHANSRQVPPKDIIRQLYEETTVMVKGQADGLSALLPLFSSTLRMLEPVQVIRRIHQCMLTEARRGIEGGVEAVKEKFPSSSSSSNHQHFSSDVEKQEPEDLGHHKISNSSKNQPERPQTAPHYEVKASTLHVAERSATMSSAFEEDHQDVEDDAQTIEQKKHVLLPNRPRPPTAAATVVQRAPIVTDSPRYQQPKSNGGTMRPTCNSVEVVKSVNRRVQETLREHGIQSQCPCRAFVVRKALSGSTSKSKKKETEHHQATSEGGMVLSIERAAMQDKLTKQALTSPRLTSATTTMMQKTSDEQQKIDHHHQATTNMADELAKRILALKEQAIYYRQLSVDEKHIVHEFERRELRFHHARAMLNVKRSGLNAKVRKIEEVMDRMKAENKLSENGVADYVKLQPNYDDDDESIRHKILLDLSRSLAENNKQKEHLLKERELRIHWAQIALGRLKRAIPLSTG